MGIFSTDKESDIVVEEKEKFDKPSDYNVVIHNNDYTSYEEVIIIVSQAFNMTNDQAFQVASTVDKAGKGICGTFSKEVAEMKLLIVDTIKQQLIQMLPHRQQAITMLKFTIEKA